MSAPRRWRAVQTQRHGRGLTPCAL